LGLTLEETDLRRLTGVSVIAIRRVGGVELDYPTPEETLELGDRVLLIGDSAEIEAFGALARGEAAVPSKENSCQWLGLPPGSPAIDRPLVDLNLPLKYQVEIQAIRREGRFMRLPEETTILEEGDLLLLCGRLDDLQPTAAWLTNQENPQTTVSISG
jgi:monovalent cation:H+ antiporter-2, CPA2 family